MSYDGRPPAVLFLAGRLMKLDEAKARPSYQARAVSLLQPKSTTARYDSQHSSARTVLPQRTMSLRGCAPDFQLGGREKVV
jgi:hypothetical protein